MECWDCGCDKISPLGARFLGGVGQTMLIHGLALMEHQAKFSSDNNIIQ